MSKAIVIGSGFSSLSAACYLAREGMDVTILEKNHQAGGRATVWKKDGFTFDMGPTWYWMPDIFEDFFADFNHKPSDFYSLIRLDPSYRIYVGKDQFEDIPISREALNTLFEKYQPGSSKLLEQFLAEAGYTYQLAVKEMAHKPGNSFFEFLTVDTVRRPSLFMQSLRKYVRSKFTHPFLISLLEFPVLFLGAKPGDTPAFYNFMNYADLQMGTWYPHDGMYEVVKGIQKLATNLGVKFKFDCDVHSLEPCDNKVKNVLTSYGIFPSDVVVSGADYHHTETLLPEIYRNYPESYWQKKTFAPSALLFFVAINKKLSRLRHHTLFFDAPFDAHAHAIYDVPSWPEQPLFYLNIPSITDPKVAPHGRECMTILVPIAPGIEDNDEVREKYFHKILDRLEDMTGQEIRPHILFRRSYCINDFVKDYNAYKGNAYGLANTLRQTGAFRPSVRNKKLKNLFYTGQLTVPGGGVPPALISGKIVATEVMKKIRKHVYAD